MKKPLFSYKKTKLVGKWHRFTVFTNILMFGFTDDSWILPSASVVNVLLWHILSSLWKTPLFTYERMRVEKAINISTRVTYRKIVFSTNGAGTTGYPHA